MKNNEIIVVNGEKYKAELSPKENYMKKNDPCAGCDFNVSGACMLTDDLYDGECWDEYGELILKKV